MSERCLIREEDSPRNGDKREIIQNDLLSHKEPAKMPPNIRSAFNKAPYTGIFDEADSKHFNEYEPILRVNNHIEDEKNQDQVDYKSKTNERKKRIEDNLKKIYDVENEADQETIEAYSEVFQNRAETDILTLAEVELDVLDEENKKAMELKEQAKRDELEEQHKRQNDIKRLERESKDELAHQNELFKKQIRRLENQSIAYTAERDRAMKMSFKKVTGTLKQYLRTTKDEVEGRYKNLIITEGDRADYLKKYLKNRPQILKLRVELVRCVKDKLPKGRYAILCTLLNKIGGEVLKYGEEESVECRKVTIAKTHSGEYYFNNIRFEETLNLYAPPAKKSEPSMVYLFELFLLKSKEYTYDQVLGWGVFPLINSEFELNLGRFKVISFI